MKIQTKLRPFQFLQRFFPVWALRRQSKIVSRAFETDLETARNSEEREQVEYQKYFELSEYDEAIQTIHSKRLMSEARELFIFVPDLKWEEGRWGGRFLNEESLSRLHQVVKAQKDSIRDYRIKFATVLTGIIGALIGLIAVWRK